MLKKITLTLSVTALVLTLGACTNEQSGQIIGGIIGGAAASNVGKGSGRTVATVAGTIAGTMIGGAIGRHMDESDRLKTQQSLEHNRTNEPSSWHNPDSGYDYTVTPTETYQTDTGAYCREYTTDVVIGGKTERAYGKACRQPDGSWQVVS